GNVTLQAATLSGASPAPLPPTGVSASDGSSTTNVTVTWNASANASSYTLFRSTTGGQQGTSIGTSATTSFTDTTVTPGVTYFYSVSATNVAGTSAPSTQDSGFAATSSTAGALSGSGAASSGAVNLTTAGSSDWAKWPNYIHKASGGAQISTYAVVGVGA